MGRSNSNSLIQQLNEVREQFRFTAFQNDTHLLQQRPLRIDGFGGGQNTRFTQWTAGPELACKLFELGLRPALKDLGMFAHNAFDNWICCLIKRLTRRPGRLKQFIHLDAQSMSQFVQRAGVRIVGAADQAAERSLIEPRSLDDFVKRKPVPRHQTAHVPGDCGGVVLLESGKSGNHAVCSRRQSKAKAALRYVYPYTISVDELSRGSAEIPRIEMDWARDAPEICRNPQPKQRLRVHRRPLLFALFGRNHGPIDWEEQVANAVQ